MIDEWTSTSVENVSDQKRAWIQLAIQRQNNEEDNNQSRLLKPCID